MMNAGTVIEALAGAEAADAGACNAVLGELDITKQPAPKDVNSGGIAIISQ
jgi:hypothetical protein